MQIDETTVIHEHCCQTLVVGEVFVFFKCLLPDEKMPECQELALTRIVDGLSTAGKSAVLFLCRHKEYDTNKDIAADLAIVDRIYLNNCWYKGNGYTVKELTDRFINWAETLRPER